MSLFATNVNLSILSNAKLADYRSRVIAAGVAVLFVYALNFVFQFFVTYFRSQSEIKAKRRLFQICQVLYWFGIAGMFSIYPPFYYGAFNAVIAYITLIIVVLMHIFCFVDRKVNDRSLFSIFYFFYHLLVMIWIIVGLILGYIWSRQAYEKD